MYFYVYYSYEEWGRGYIGKRQSSCHPEDDVLYMGSFTDETFNPKYKIILEIFDNEEEALNVEILLHDFFKVDINPHFANKSRQTSRNFIYHREWTDEQKELLVERNKKVKWTEQLRKKVSDSLSGRVWITNGTLNKQLISETENIPKGWWRGFTQSTSEESRQRMSAWQKGKPKWNEEQKQKMSESRRGKKWWNNGIEQRFCITSPGIEWQPGRIKRLREYRTSPRRSDR